MTPGPWSINGLNSSLICAGRQLIALVLRDLNNDNPDERERNAKVIAAAPAMLELVALGTVLKVGEVTAFRQRCEDMLHEYGLLPDRRRSRRTT